MLLKLIKNHRFFIKLDWKPSPKSSISSPKKVDSEVKVTVPMQLPKASVLDMLVDTFSRICLLQMVCFRTFHWDWRRIFSKFELALWAFLAPEIRIETVTK